jgi:hypothetical protein
MLEAFASFGASIRARLSGPPRSIEIGETHPLNAVDAERSKARVADISIGLTSPRDGQYWRDKAEERVATLEEDSRTYGLLPHEEEELATIERLLAAGAGK